MSLALATSQAADDHAQGFEKKITGQQNCGLT